MRFLEAQNKKLSGELGNLRENWGKETERVKQLYEKELDQLRNLLNNAEKAKAELEVRIHAMDSQLNEAQKQ